MTLTVDNSSFWDEKYEKGETGWDLKNPNSVFLEVLNDKKIILPGKILIPGCGKGYDAVEAAKKSFDVTALDFSQNAISFAKNLAEKENVKINFLVEDFFNLDENFNNSFDAVYDYTMFCAINPERRKDYAKKISLLLKPGGKFIALFFLVEEREGGPPFGINILDTFKIFSNYLKLSLSNRQINSIELRKGGEVLQVYVK